MNVLSISECGGVYLVCLTELNIITPGCYCISWWHKLCSKFSSTQYACTIDNPYERHVKGVVTYMSPVEVLATRTRICDRIKVCLFFWSIIFSGLKVNLQFRGHLDPLIDSQTRLWSMLILVTNVSTPPSLTRHPFAEGRVWSCSNRRVVATPETWCDQSDLGSS